MPLLDGREVPIKTDLYMIHDIDQLLSGVVNGL
jgi:hypothetical protein